MNIKELKELVGEELYNKEVKKLKNGETKTIFSSNNMDIDIKKVSSRVLVFVNKYGTDSLNIILNNVCSLA